MFRKLVITTDQGILEDAVAQTIFRAHGFRYRVGSTLKGEGRYVRNRDTKKLDRHFSFSGKRSVGHEYGTWADARYDAQPE